MSVNAFHAPRLRTPLLAPTEIGMGRRVDAVISDEASSGFEVKSHVNMEPSVRGATQADLDSLVHIELSAFADVYGAKPTPEIIADVRAKYEERVGVLGEYVRVIESPEGEVYGTIICCPTSLGKEDFMSGGRDLTDSGEIREIFDPKGNNAYVVNLAVLPGKQGNGDHFRLFADAIRVGIESGIERAYFKSRLPGFERWMKGSWVQERVRMAERFDVPPPTSDELAEIYWKLTKDRDGVERPLDPLLRLYASFGCTPLCLVKDAWKPDAPSGGYGVLCEFKSPSVDSYATDATTNFKNDHIGGTEAEVHGGSYSESSMPPEEGVSDIGFIRRALNWAKARKKGLIVGGLVLSTAAYEGLRGGLGETINQVQEHATWALPAYMGSLGVFAGGAAMMLAGAGRKVSWKDLISQPREELREVAAKMSESKLVKAGFWANAGGAVAAAGVAITALAEVLPPAAAAAAITIPAADLVQTASLRYWVYGLAKKRQNANVNEQ